MNRVMRLADAVSAFVEPGMHLHFPSTPSRSNAAIREVARRFRGKQPGFTLSASGFHSSAHLLAMLGLGRRYIGCFFGDNYPIPRPNKLYQDLGQSAEVELQIWSLLSYVEALRAAAYGKPYALTQSLAGTDMARQLAASGAFVEVEHPDPASGGGKLGLVRALQPDVVFVHALLGDERGNVVVSKPSCEGYWSAIAARRGVVVTVERLLKASDCARFRDAMPIPRHRVLAICEEPGGCHPQPLYAEPRFEIEGYPDDFDHYRLWRLMATRPDLFARFSERVLDGPDGGEGYKAFVSWSRTDPEVGDALATPPRPPVPAQPQPQRLAKRSEIMVVLAARAICERVKERGHRLIIAGIGHSFIASRLAKLWLEAEGIDVDVIVETGLVGVPCGADAHEFLLSHRNMEGAARISDVADVLGALTCGANNRCLGVLGAGQVDERGNLNTTLLSSGRLLVGSGGANDIASSAAEVVVLCRCGPSRLVERVDYVTSPGKRVTRIVTDACTFKRRDQAAGWELEAVYPANGGGPLQQSLEAIREQCPWRYSEGAVKQFASPISTFELRGVHTLDPRGELWTRE